MSTIELVPVLGFDARDPRCGSAVPKVDDCTFSVVENEVAYNNAIVD